MRLNFREKPWDLVMAVGYVVVVAATLLALGVGNVLAVFLVFFAPGYVLVAALFPGSQTLGRTEVGWIERIALSVGDSIAVVPLLGLVLNFTPWGIRFRSIVATIALFTAGVGYAAYWRRMRLPPDSRLSLTLDLDFPEWREYTAVDKGVTTILAVSVVVAGGTLVYVLVTPRSGERFTDFYVLGPGGNASGYPRALNVSDRKSVV